MKVSQMMSRFAGWWNTEEARTAVPTEDAHMAYRDTLVRSELQKAQLLFRKWQYAGEQIQQAQEAQRQFVQELQALRADVQREVELPSGENVALDLSQGERWQQFWRDLDEVIQPKSKPAALPRPADQNMDLSSLQTSAPVEIVSKQLPVESEARQRFEQAVQAQRYDARFSDQESDELLHMLSL